jgi:hypothetical protein
MSERWLGLPALEVSVKVASGTTASRLTGGRPNIGDWPDTLGKPDSGCGTGTWALWLWSEAVAGSSPRGSAR